MRLHDEEENASREQENQCTADVLSVIRSIFVFFEHFLDCFVYHTPLILMTNIRNIHIHACTA